MRQALSIDGSSHARGTPRGYALYPVNHGHASIAVESLEPYSTRALEIIKDALAPTRYGFTLTVAPGVRLVPSSTGGIELLSSSGRMIGQVAPPWAIDAMGRAVPTTYEVDGTTLIQTVLHPGADYPVVADPWVTSDPSPQRPGIFDLHLTPADQEVVLKGDTATAAGAAITECPPCGPVVGGVGTALEIAIDKEFNPKCNLVLELVVTSVHIPYPNSNLPDGGLGPYNGPPVGTVPLQLVGYRYESCTK